MPSIFSAALRRWWMSVWWLILMPAPPLLMARESVFWQTTRTGVNFTCKEEVPSWLLVSSRNLSVMSSPTTRMLSGSLARIHTRSPLPKAPAVW